MLPGVLPEKREGAMTANEEIGTFVRCYWRNAGGTYTDFPESAWELLSACVRRDPFTREARAETVLQITSVIGVETIFQKADVGMVYLSTPEVRRRSYERDALWEREAKEQQESQPWL